MLVEEIQDVTTQNILQFINYRPVNQYLLRFEVNLPY
jgi:hypothetical protein